MQPTCFDCAALRHAEDDGGLELGIVLLDQTQQLAVQEFIELVLIALFFKAMDAVNVALQRDRAKLRAKVVRLGRP